MHCFNVKKFGVIYNYTKLTLTMVVYGTYKTQNYVPFITTKQ